MQIEQDLQILIPTFNRASALNNLLTILSADNSPVKNCEIKIFDNASTDNTAEIVTKFKTLLPGLQYNRNLRNIGLAGNIIRCLEEADRKYFWILFDNDHLDFTHWKPIEEAVWSDKYDVVFTANYYLDSQPDWAQLIIMMIYLPTFICKTENINDNVMTNSIIDAYTIHPQMALISSLANQNKSYFIPKEAVWEPILNPETGEDYSFDRISNKSTNFRIVPGHIEAGLLNALQSIKDVELRNKVIDILVSGHKQYAPLLNIRALYFLNRQGKYHTSNLIDIYAHLTQKGRRIFRKQILKGILKYYWRNTTQIFRREKA